MPLTGNGEHFVSDGRCEHHEEDCHNANGCHPEEEELGVCVLHSSKSSTPSCLPLRTHCTWFVLPHNASSKFSRRSAVASVVLPRSSRHHATIL